MIHIKDHEVKECLCLEAERLGLAALIMGSHELRPLPENEPVYQEVPKVLKGLSLCLIF
jgi:hypothetical protein